MDIKYVFTLDKFLNNEVDISKLDNEIRLSAITISLAFVDFNNSECGCWFRSNLSDEDLTTLSEIVSNHDGIPDAIDDLQYVEIRGVSNPIPVDLFDEFRDRSGKLRVHQTSRKLGTIICWTGEGDDPSNPSLVGGGTPFSFSYFAGQTDPLVKYIDFNTVENETWLHEGYVTWKNCYLDTLDLMIVPRVVSYTISSGTNYNLYGGYLIVPAIPGQGTIDITSDITTHSGGLVYMPDDDLGESSTAYFDATWNSNTKRYENITPNYTGTGNYNMFTTEIKFAHFVRKMPLLNSGFIALNSSDTDQLGAGMRLKMIADTDTTISGVGDHDWSMACTMCLHRAKTV